MFETGVEEKVADHRCVVEGATVDRDWLCNKLPLFLVSLMLRLHKQCFVPRFLSVLHLDRVVSTWGEQTASTKPRGVYTVVCSLFVVSEARFWCEEAVDSWREHWERVTAGEHCVLSTNRL